MHTEGGRQVVYISNILACPLLLTLHYM